MKSVLVLVFCYAGVLSSYFSYSLCWIDNGITNRILYFASSQYAVFLFSDFFSTFLPSWKSTKFNLVVPQLWLVAFKKGILKSTSTQKLNKFQDLVEINSHGVFRPVFCLFVTIQQQNDTIFEIWERFAPWLCSHSNIQEGSKSFYQMPRMNKLPSLLSFLFSTGSIYC